MRVAHELPPRELLRYASATRPLVATLILIFTTIAGLVVGWLGDLSSSGHCGPRHLGVRDAQMFAAADRAPGRGVRVVISGLGKTHASAHTTESRAG
jgi:hypothetical protein